MRSRVAGSNKHAPTSKPASGIATVHFWRASSHNSAEKALKGLLHWRKGDHPRIHLIATLLDELGSIGDIGTELDADLRTLDKYYTTTRYPDTLDYALPAASFSRREADAALVIASSVIERVAELLTQPPVSGPGQSP